LNSPEEKTTIKLGGGGCTHEIFTETDLERTITAYSIHLLVGVEDDLVNHGICEEELKDVSGRFCLGCLR
jgi:hypothetical protein